MAVDEWVGGLRCGGSVLGGCRFLSMSLTVTDWHWEPWHHLSVGTAGCVQAAANSEHAEYWTTRMHTR